jgi:3-oxoacyl-[acyl-carrier protein] reductase
VTGAGNGLGRAESVALARAGAMVVLNDLPGDAVAETAALIAAAGGQAVAHAGDIGDWETGEGLVSRALATCRRLDILVNNAGVLRDRMVFTMSAKAGIAALTVSTARACARYGVRANAICPRARTAMLAGLVSPPPADGPDPLDPEHVTPLVTYLASPAAERINGEVFVVHGGVAAVMNPPSIRAVFRADTPDGMWTLPAVHDALAGAFADGSPDSPGFACTETMDLASETIGFG